MAVLRNWEQFQICSVFFYTPCIIKDKPYHRSKKVPCITISGLNDTTILVRVVKIIIIQLWTFGRKTSNLSMHYDIGGMHRYYKYWTLGNNYKASDWISGLNKNERSIANSLFWKVERTSPKYVMPHFFLNRW
jgi:hypothetical protein